jgi:hypothetical protein
MTSLNPIDSPANTFLPYLETIQYYGNDRFKNKYYQAGIEGDDTPAGEPGQNDKGKHDVKNGIYRYI